MRCWPKLTSFFILLASSGAVWADKTEGAVPMDRIVAIVNKEAIFLSELKENVAGFREELERQGKPTPRANEKDFERHVLDQLVNRKLIATEIERRGLAANTHVIDRAIESVMHQNNFRSIQELEGALLKEGMTMEEYRKSFKEQIENSRVLSEVIRPRVQITDEDIASEYRRRIEGESKEIKTQVRMIYKAKGKGRATLADMQKLRNEIENGTLFERIADRETEGPGKGKGGSIGLVSPKDLQKPLQASVTTLPEGEVSPVIETEQGFYLVQVTERIAVGKESLEEVRDEIREELTRKETNQHFEAFVQGLREKAHIEVMLQ